MTDIKCEITSEPQEATRIVLKQSSSRGPYFMGDGDVCILCANCDFILAKNVSEEQIQHQIHTPDRSGLVLQCPRCKEFNELCSP
jgi:phage FluMu protein Com